MENINLPPFYIGQKVIYITGIHMPKNSKHIVTEIYMLPCRCSYTIGIDNIPLKFDKIQPHVTSIECANCGKISSPSIYPNGVVAEKNSNHWAPGSFRAIEEQKYPLISLSKVIEKEKELVSAN